MDLSAIRRRIPALNVLAFHHAALFLAASAAVVTAILLAGASSNALSQRVFLIQFSYSQTNQSSLVSNGAWENITRSAFDAIQSNPLRVRVGYFGLCAAQNQETWNCRSRFSSLVAARAFDDPLGMLNMADTVKNDVVFPGLLIGSGGLALISIVLLSLFPGWHEERDEDTGSDIDVMPFPNRRLMLSTCGAASLATIFALISAIWQHTASATAATILETSSFLAIRASVGATAAGLAWLVFGLWFVNLAILLVALASILLVEAMSDVGLDDKDESNEFPSRR